MLNFFLSSPFIIILAVLFCLFYAYLVFIFPKFIPHFLLSFSLIIPLFYALTNIPNIPTTTVFVVLFGPVVLLKTSFSAVRRLWPVGLYLGVVILFSWLNNIDLWEYKSLFIPLVIMSLCYLSLAENGSDTEQQLTLFIYIFIIWTLINTLFSVFHLITGGHYFFLSSPSGQSYGIIDRGYGLIGIANSLGMTYSIAIPFLAALALTNTKNMKVFLFLFMINVIGLIITFSRGAILGTYISMFFVLLFLKEKKWRNIYVVFTLFIFFSYSAIIVLLPGQYAYFFQGEDASAKGRPLLVQIGIEMFMDRPIMGLGIGGYLANTYRYGLSSVLEAHNTFIQVLAEHGLVGLSAFIYVIYRSMKGYFRYLKNGESEMMRTLSIGGLASIVAILINGYFHALEWKLELWLPIFLGFLMEHLRYREYSKVNAQLYEFLPLVSGIK